MLQQIDRRAGFILVIMALIMYANTLGHDYAWDDSIVITENARVKKGIKGIPDLFLKYNSDYKADKYGYRPIVLSTFAIEYGLFGAKPGIGHFMNIVYFALLCYVMYGVLRQVLFRFGNLAPFLITTLFIVHPIHVEVVANIKSRDEIFALLFSLLSLKQFIMSRKNGKAKHLLPASLYFICALMSKEGAITFLAIIPLTLFYMDEKLNLKKLLLPALLCLVLGIAGYLIFKLYTGSQLGIKASQGAGIFYESGIIGNSFFYIDVFNTKVANALIILLLYLKNLFYPLDLIYFYGYNQVPVANWQQLTVWVSLLVNVSLLLMAIFFYRSNREISYGIFYYFISISIYLHIVRTLADTMADRFLFAPSLGMCIVFIFLCAKVFKFDLRTADSEKLFKSSGDKHIRRFRSVLMFVLLTLSFLTFSRNRVWKNDKTLITHDLPNMENCSRAHYYYADLLKQDLLRNYDREAEEKMIHHYRRSYTICEEAYYAYLSLGTYFCEKGKYKEGINLLDTMVTLFPGAADAHFYLGGAFSETGQHTKAIYHLEKSLLLAPQVLETYLVLAIAYSKKGEFQTAMATVDKAKAKFAESAQIYEVLGIIYYDKGDAEQSAKFTLEKLRFGEDPQMVYSTVIGRFQVLKQDSLAGVYYKEALAKGIFTK